MGQFGDSVMICSEPSAVMRMKGMELPSAAREYLNSISECVGYPIEIVSVGPDRNQTIRV